MFSGKFEILVHLVTKICYFELFLAIFSGFMVKLKTEKIFIAEIKLCKDFLTLLEAEGALNACPEEKLRFWHLFVIQLTHEINIQE